MGAEKIMYDGFGWKSMNRMKGTWTPKKNEEGELVGIVEHGRLIVFGCLNARQT